MIGKLFICMLSFVLAGIASWLALWCANIVNYLISLPFSIIDLIAENSTDFIQFVHLAITTGIAYFGCFFIFFDIVYGEVCDLKDDYEWLDYLVLILLVFSIIVVCDPRLFSSLPSAFSAFIYNLKVEYSYQLLGTVSWDRLDFSGDRIPAMQYTIFDIAVVLSAVFAIITRKHPKSYNC